MTAMTTRAGRVPRLENGDHLTRHEFHRRYKAMPPETRAELIEGIVYMASPLRAGPHGEPHADLMGWLAVYKAATRGVGVADNATVLLDADNEPQPDASLYVRRPGGRPTVNESGYIARPPELAAEVAASSTSIDLGAKKDAYRRNGIQEYLVWRVEDEAIDWFALTDGQYQSLPADADGVVKSRVFPGLWLKPAALLADDLAGALAVLQRGLATPEHAAFVAALAAQAKG